MSFVLSCLWLIGGMGSSCVFANDIACRRGAGSTALQPPQKIERTAFSHGRSSMRQSGVFFNSIGKGEAKVGVKIRTFAAGSLTNSCSNTKKTYQTAFSLSNRTR